MLRKIIYFEQWVEIKHILLIVNSQSEENPKSQSGTLQVVFIGYISSKYSF